MTTATHVLFVVALKSEPIWYLRSTRYFFHREHGTNLNLIIELSYMHVSASFDSAHVVVDNLMRMVYFFPLTEEIA
jgi:hypothetical protein